MDVGGRTVGRIGAGLLVLLCVEHGDGDQQVSKMLEKTLKLRIFEDDAGKMNRSVLDMDGHGGAGEMLVISQFTLAADVWSGNRPSFAGAAPAQAGRGFYELYVQKARQFVPHVATGEFGAHMQVHLVNDGPVTIPIRVAPLQA